MRYRFGNGAHRAPGWVVVVLLHGAVLWAILQATGPDPAVPEPHVQTLLIQGVEILLPAQPTALSQPHPPPNPVPGQRADKPPEPVPPPSPATPVPPPFAAPLTQPAPVAPVTAVPPSPAPAREPAVASPHPAPAVVAAVVAVDQTPAPPVPAPVVESASRPSAQVPVRAAMASQFPAAANPSRVSAPSAEMPRSPVLASESRAASAQTTPYAGQMAAAPAPASRGDGPGVSAAHASPQRPAPAQPAERSTAPLASESVTASGRGLVSQTPASAPAAAPVAAPPGVSIALACPVQVAPEMPSGVYREQGDEWQVTAQIAIRNGVVQSVKIVSGPRVFHDKVREAIRKYQCKADGGEVLATQVFRFKLGQ